MSLLLHGMPRFRTKHDADFVLVLSLAGEVGLPVYPTIANIAEYPPMFGMKKPWLCGGALRAPPPTQGAAVAQFGVYLAIFAIAAKMTPWVQREAYFLSWDSMGEWAPTGGLVPQFEKSRPRLSYRGRQTMWHKRLNKNVFDPSGAVPGPHRVLFLQAEHPPKVSRGGRKKRTGNSSMYLDPQCNITCNGMPNIGRS